MKNKFKQLSLFLLLIGIMVNCSEEEMRYIDPMIDGITENIEESVQSLSTVPWNVALFGYKENRIKLLTMLDRIENDKYSGDNYDLEDPNASASTVEQALAMVEFKLDSVWSAYIQGPFDGINKNSAGIVNFGTNAYNNAETEVADAMNWLLEEKDDGNPENDLIPIELLTLEEQVSVLVGLAALNEQEVIEFVNSIKAQYDTMLDQYADLAPEVETSPYFSTGQKELYASLSTSLVEIGDVIEENLSLSTKNELDAINRDLYSLVYFVENNYTSPAQAPKVYGEISSITELRWLSEEAVADDYSRAWVLTTDIDAAETRRWNEGYGYLPIEEFTGVFDGQYHMISGLFMNDFPDFYTGFIGRLVNGGEIRNLGLVNVDIVCRQPQGGPFSGFVHTAKISNCFSHGVVGVKGQSGGFVGRVDFTELTNCFAAVDVYNAGAGNHGNFAGGAASTKLVNCYGIGENSSRAANSNALIGNVFDDNMTGEGIFFDSSTATLLKASNKDYFNALVTDLPTAQWNDLANFPTFSADVWEIKTIPEIEENARPYLKGFNYDALKDFILPPSE